MAPRDTFHCLLFPVLRVGGLVTLLVACGDRLAAPPPEASDLGDLKRARFDASKLLGEQRAELVVGERARNVLPSGPALPPPDARDRHAASGGTVTLSRTGDAQVEVSAVGLVFDGRDPIDLAPRLVALAAPPP